MTRLVATNTRLPIIHRQRRFTTPLLQFAVNPFRGAYPLGWLPMASVWQLLANERLDVKEKLSEANALDAKKKAFQKNMSKGDKKIEPFLNFHVNLCKLSSFEKHSFLSHQKQIHGVAKTLQTPLLSENKYCYSCNFFSVNLKNKNKMLIVYWYTKGKNVPIKRYKSIKLKINEASPSNVPISIILSTNLTPRKCIYSHGTLETLGIFFR